jgi:hypothetical protein
MSFTTYMADTVKRYIDEAGLIPAGSLAAQYFTALAYFRLEHHYFDLDDVPEPYEGMVVFQRLPDRRAQVIREGDKWYLVQYIEDSIYK